MRNLSDILNDYFANRDLAGDELREVLAYRERCIAQAAEGSFKSATSYQPSFDSQMEVISNKLSGFEEMLMNSLKGKRAIELGPGCNPMHSWLFARGAASYTGIELFYSEESARLSAGKNSEIVHSDALSFLVSQPGNSAIVVSRGVLNMEVMPSFNYMRFLIREIYRITPAGNLTIHAMGILSHDEKRFFREAGFKPLDERDYNAVWVKE